MATETNDNNLPNSEELEALKKGLKALYQEPIAVPHSLNSAMRSRIRRHFRSETKRILGLRYLAPLAAAASILIVFTVALHFYSKLDKPSTYHALRKEDVDRNGEVNILDAFVLARELKSRKGLDPVRDINGDGTVDEKDVDAVAYAAVSMEGGA